MRQALELLQAVLMEKAYDKAEEYAWNLIEETDRRDSLCRMYKKQQQCLLNEIGCLAAVF